MTENLILTLTRKLMKRNDTDFWKKIGTINKLAKEHTKIRGGFLKQFAKILLRVILDKRSKQNKICSRFLYENLRGTFRAIAISHKLRTKSNKNIRVKAKRSSLMLKLLSVFEAILTQLEWRRQGQRREKREGEEIANKMMKMKYLQAMQYQWGISGACDDRSCNRKNVVTWIN